MSLPYHIGNGWFGGFLPAISFVKSGADVNIGAEQHDVSAGAHVPASAASQQAPP